MVGTEYFVRGTEPDEVCHLHVGRSLFGHVAGWFGAAREVRSPRRAPPIDAQTEAPDVAPVSPAQQEPAVAQAPAPEEKKRGFWGRLFGTRDKQTRRPEAGRPPTGGRSSDAARCRSATSIGHARQVALLAGAVQRGSVPPTLLLAGPAGVGKWRVARALAQAMNCPALAAGDACGSVPVLRSHRPRHARRRDRPGARRHRHDQDRPGARGAVALRLPARSRAGGGWSPCATPTPSPKARRTRCSSRSRSRRPARCSC